MASPGSFIRSAAQATSSAYRRLPIRWRLAGGSALLTLVILLGFAAIVGVLTTRRIESDFNRQVADAGDRAAGPGAAASWCSTARPSSATTARDLAKGSPDLDDVRREPEGRGDPARRRRDGDVLEARPQDAPVPAAPARTDQQDTTATASSRARSSCAAACFYVQYARKLSDVQATANRVRVFLGLGVLGGAALALLAGLATATRAMAPITRLTDAARAIARTRDPSQRIPHPESDDEVVRAGAARSRGCCARSTRRATRPRRRSRASASSSPTPRTSCARR